MALDSSTSHSSSANNGAKKPLLPETIADTSSSSSPPDAIPTHAYVTLATAVIALSSVGPSLDLQHGVAPVLKIYWRMTGTWMTLFPIAALSLYREGPPKLSRHQAITFLCASFSYAVMCIGFVLSLEYTSVGNAVIFSNTHALLLLLGRFLVGSPVSLLESGGASIAFIGGVFCTYDESLSAEATVAPHVDEVAPIWVGCFGDLIAVISALGGTTYLVLASTIRARFPSVYVFVFMNMVTASMITLTFILLVGQEISVSRDIHIGLWGFMNLRYDRLPLEMFMVVICNLTGEQKETSFKVFRSCTVVLTAVFFKGSMGYIRSTQYFDNLVISVATLMEPVVASALACIVGVGVLPGFLGLIGNILVALGTVIVINPRGQKKQ